MSEKVRSVENRLRKLEDDASLPIGRFDLDLGLNKKQFNPVEGFPWGFLSFGISLSGSTLTVNAGYVFTQLTSLAKVSVAQTTFALAATEIYIYVSCAADGSTASVLQTASFPTTTTWRAAM